MAEQFAEKADGCLECNDCGAGVRTDNLGEDQDVHSIHDSISGSCSSRSSSRLSDISDTGNVFFKQAADGIQEPTEETEKRREAAKPAPLSNKPIRKMTEQLAEGKSTREVQEENKKLKLFDKCKVCCTNEAIVMTYPCNHLELCRPCAGNTQTCPVCHEPISLKRKMMANRADNYQ